MPEDIAKRDDNHVPTIQGVSSVDEQTPTDIWVNPDIDGSGTHGVILKVDDE